MNPSARRLDQILSGSTLAANLLARLAAGRRAAIIVAPLCQELAPGFDATHPGTCDLRDKVLRIWLPSSAQANKLRQAIPSLLSCLHANGLEISEIKIGVQPGRVRENPQHKMGESLEKDGLDARTGYRQESQLLGPLAFSEKLVVTLPDCGLRQAIDGLRSCVATRLARIRESNQSFDKQDQGKNNTDTQTRKQQAPGP